MKELEAFLQKKGFEKHEDVFASPLPKPERHERNTLEQGLSQSDNPRVHHIPLLLSLTSNLSPNWNYKCQ